MDTLVKQSQKFWNKRPCNINHSLKKVGTKEYFYEVEAKKYTVEPHIPKLAEFEEKPERRKVFQRISGDAAHKTSG